MLVDVVQHCSVLVDLDQILKFAVDDHGYIVSGGGSEFEFDLKVPTLSRVEIGTVGTPTGHVVKHEQRASFAMPPILLFDHVAFQFTHGATGLQKSKVAQEIFGGVVAHQLEGFVGIFFPFHDLFDGRQLKFLKAEGISGDGSVESAAVHQPHDHPVGHSVLEQVGDVEASQVMIHAEGSDFTAHGGVHGHLIFSLGTQIHEHGFVQSQLTQVKPNFDVGFVQTGCQTHSIHEEVGAVEMKFHLDFHARHQHFARVKDFQMRFEHQRAGPTSGILGRFVHHGVQGVFLILG